MKNTAPIIFAIALSLATTLFLTVAGGTNPTIIKCEGVPSMPAAAACGKVSGGSKRMAELCVKVLRVAPTNSETTVYAYKALEAAEASTEATWGFIDGQLSHNASHNASLNGDLRAAYSDCHDMYEMYVMWLISGVKESLAECDFKEIAMKADLVTAIVGVDECLHDLRRAGGGSLTLPLYDTVLADRDMTLLASLLVGMAANKTSSIGLAN